MEAGVRWAKQIPDTRFSPEAIERALHEGFSQVQLPVESVMGRVDMNWEKYGRVYEVFDCNVATKTRKSCIKIENTTAPTLHQVCESSPAEIG
jgi:hypothetical protein